MAKTRRLYTFEEKQRLVTEIERRYRAGEGALSAIAKSLGTAESNYYHWLRAGIRPTPEPAARRLFTPEQREQLRAEIDSLRDEGMSLEAACGAVGIAESSYRRWRDDATPLTLRPVEVTALVPAPSALEPILTIVAPGGYRVEGLAIETAAQLLRALA